MWASLVALQVKLMLPMLLLLNLEEAVLEFLKKRWLLLIDFQLSVSPGIRRPKLTSPATKTKSSLQTSS